MTTSYLIDEPGLTAPAGLGTVVQRIAAGQKYAVAFGGQGTDWLAPAADLLVDFDLGADLTKIAHEAVAILAPLADEFVTAGVFDLAGWIDAGEAPRSAAATIPGILITQLGALRALGLQGVDVVAHPPCGIIAHSQGVLAAHVVRGLRAADALAYARIIGVATDRIARECGLVGSASAPAMLAVTGAPVEQVADLVAQHPGLVARVRNGVRNVVVSGPAEQIAAFRRSCAARTATEQADVDAKRRGGVVFDPALETVPAPVAFHHPDLQPAVDLAATWAEQVGLDGDRACELAAATLVNEVDWPRDVDAVIGTGAAWILDLGPADLAARMTRIASVGRGVGVIATGTSRGHRELTVAGAAPEVDAAWSTFAPTLVHLPDGRTAVETAFTRLTGKSPILLAGMTPTTVDAPIVAAAANAGFWAELAGGGQVTEEIFADRVAELDGLLEPGRGYAFNSLLLDPYLWKLQLGGRKLVQKARAAGAPIEAVVVTAGIPETDDAVALIEELREAGIPQIAFKPGTVAQIDQVLAIADAAPTTPIIVHVEGGKAGGHHSWEDLDELLIATYGKLRRRSNVVLCVGGGIGTPERAADYLLGRWAHEHGYGSMPVDGILVGTAAMATLEATTAPEVKQALVAASGTPAWVGVGTAEGGVTSGRSQLGADIHEIDNAASRTGRLLDEVAGDADAVAARRAEIIAALDCTAKPYFGDLETLTYAGLLDRYLELAYRPWSRWLDVTWAERFLDLLHRAEARLHASDRGEIDSLFAGVAEVDDADAAMSLLTARFAHATTTLLHPADRAFFVQTCRTAGKPVNFVPVVDGDVRRWWRSDSLWQAHDAVYTADQVCIIPGPEAVAGIDRLDEPVADLLARFEDSTVDALETVGHSAVRVSSRLRATGHSGAVARVLAAPDAVWADRAVPNPALRLGAVAEWSAAGGEALHAETGATLVAESDDLVLLRVPVGGDEPLTLRLSLGADGTQPVVQDPASALQTLLAVAAGGELPEVTDGVARLSVDASRSRLLDHGAVTSAGLRSDLQPAEQVPDALVGLAWPAVFAVVGSARTADGIAVAEGVLDLVHLDHTLRLHDEAAQVSGVLEAEARLSGVEDTDVGRVVTVDVTLSADAVEVASFTERLAIRGRRGAIDAAAPAVAGGVEPVDATRRTRRSTSIVVPESMTAFATVSGDHNPLHTALAAARLAGLEAPIAHGMFVSAAAQHAVTARDSAAPGRRITGWTARYLAPVAPGASLDVTVQRIGFAAGGEVVEVTCKVEGELVMVATARLAPLNTVYAFPGQGIQHVGMGMDGYGRSSAARDVWDRADAHTRKVLGFSILHVVRDNPTTIVAHGARHHHPDGVLFLTQFTQVAMATLGAAQTAELRESGVFVDGAYLCGHSVGEYNALAAISGVLSLEAVVEIVFQRGSVMHTLVPRDSAGRSDYRLAAIRPSQLGLADDEVTGFVEGVATDSGEFLQIVNYNLRGSQYAIAGTVKGLQVLEAAVEKRRAAHNGRASFILVPGIDVPFHSRVLHPGVPDFRATLSELLPAQIDPSILAGRYIPNLVPRLFSLDRAFVAEIADLVPSEPLDAVLADFDAWAAKPGELCRVVLIELLAWQFASPVRWIETQDLLFGEVELERFVEVGVGGAPTVANLASSTLKIPGLFDRAPEVVNVERDAAVVFGTDADPVVEDDPIEASETAPAPESAAPAAPSAPVAASDAPRPDDLSFAASDATKALLAVATKLRPEQIAGHDSIESLCDGVSSRRNQILLDLGTELGLGAIDGAAEADLGALSGTVNGLARGYRPFGPVLADALGDLVRKALGPSGKKPSAIADRVSGAWQLGDGWIKHVTVAFALGSRDGASVRGGDLGGLDLSDVEAAIDAAVGQVAAAQGITVALPAAGGGGDAMVDAAALGEFTEHITGSDGVLASAARLVLEQLGHAEPPAQVDQNPDTELADLVATELGTDWQRTVAAHFDADKAVLLDDRWASAREDLARLWVGREVGSFLGAGETVAVQAEWWAEKATREGRKALARSYGKAAKDARTTKPGRWADDVAVVTGASAGSIAASVVAGLLSGGAGVIATTSRLNAERLAFFKKLYRENAVDGAWLRVVPANMASFADVDALADWVGAEQTVNVGGAPQVVKPALRPTLLFPFAAPRVLGDLADAGARSETDMRVLLWSVERLIGRLASIDAQSDLAGRLHVVLPGSPNRGMFGGDGAYGESKAALDAIIAKWSAERSWAERVTLVHAIIGWVRGTGLMGGNDPLVEAVEAAGVRTWAPHEMAAELLGASTAKARQTAAREPITLDLTAGLAGADLDLAALGREAQQASADTDAGVRESDGSTYIQALPASPAQSSAVQTPDWGDVPAKPEDLVVIVGVGELGPYGSARTRYEAEVDGALSAAGVLELAWTTGLVRWENTPTPGWYDTDSGDPVPEAEIAERYHDVVAERVGVRSYADDGSMTDHTAPLLASVYLDRDMTFSVASESEARAFAAADPEHTVIAANGGEWSVTRRAGTEVRVPRKLQITRTVGGQIPTGFDPAVWGLGADMIESLDRVAVWNLVCTVDAFLSSGFTPAELLRWVHPARVANTQGTGMGGMQSMHSLYVDTLLGEPKPNDLLQEALPNVIAAHVAQSYVGGYGAMIHPVAACATTAVSVEEGVDKIRLDKADVVVAGGFDDLSVEGIVGFADMNATADTETMRAKGIDDRYLSRANDRRRGGFVESQGGGTVLLARGDVAARAGLPVLGVVAYAGSFGDGIHTSIPAPGLGALSAGIGGLDSPLARGLATVGLNTDDVSIVSKHDTSTQANDPNESELHERLQGALGRTDGNPLFVISQKTLTGHAKGGAAAFQLAGLTQVLAGGVIPPNRSLDCVDEVLAENEHLVWVREALDLGPAKVGLVTSLGFGHVSGLIAVAHPQAFVAALPQEQRADYLARAQEREITGRLRLAEAMCGGAALYERTAGRRLGESGVREREASVLLDPDSRIDDDGILQAPSCR